MGTDEQAHSDVLCARLAERWPERYADWRPAQLAAALKPHRVATRQVWAAGLDGQRANRRGVLAADLLAALDGDGPAAGFHALPPLDACALVELTRGPHTSGLACERAETFFAALGKHVAWVGDAPGLVLGRIVAQLVNEAGFAIAEGVGSIEDVDAGLELGMRHPRGPSEWDREQARATLDGLWNERREERYRPAP